TNITCTGGPALAVLPGVTFAGDTRSLKWNTVAPRIGATYSLGSDKRTLVRAGYNRYVSQMGTTVGTQSPLGYTALYIWGVDQNGDHVVQQNELMKING